ncbi:MAG: PaaI family thioesterase [Actinomycetota bacterium]|nr:PaaI family thioesterase [Actinomycetota bacterium]
MESALLSAPLGPPTHGYPRRISSSSDISKAGRDGPGEAIGLVYGEMTAESVAATVPVAPPVQQQFGLVHGGVYSTVAESICSAATAIAVASEGHIAMGQANSATFLRPMTEGTIHALATRRHAGRTTWLWDVDFTDDDGRLCATVRMTVAVRKAPSGA